MKNIPYIDSRDIVDTHFGTGRLSFHNGYKVVVEIDGKKIEMKPEQLTNRRSA